MLRNLADALGKNILRDVLHLRGLAETEAEVPPGNPKRLDLWFVPEEKQLAYPWLVRVGLEVPMERWALHEDREFVMDIQAWYKDFIETHDRQVEARVLQGLEAQRAEERRLLEAQRAEAKRQAELGQLVHLFERRLGRKLATNEHVVLATRIEALGAAHVGDLVLDLSADELAAWLKQGETCTNG